MVSKALRGNVVEGKTKGNLRARPIAPDFILKMDLFS